MAVEVGEEAVGAEDTAEREVGGGFEAGGGALGQAEGSGGFGHRGGGGGRGGLAGGAGFGDSSCGDGFAQGGVFDLGKSGGRGNGVALVEQELAL